jgi:hypothetical protein
MIDTSSNSDGHAAVVLDNALLFSAANLHVRQNGGRMVRNVNLLGIAALVMHQRLTVDRQGWEYFAAAVPQSWLPSIEPMVDIIDFDLPPQEMVAEAVVNSSNSVLLAYALTSIDRMIETEQGRDLILTYFSYTGSDMGRNRNEQDLVSLLQDRLDVAIPDMHLHLRNYEHVGTLQSLVRVLQYQHFAGELGQAYVPHDFRGSVINVLSRDRVQPAFRLVWEKLLGIMSEAIKKEYAETLEWTRPADDGSFALWERLEMPTFLAMALERTTQIGDLFHHVREIRNGARELRQLLEQFTHIENQARGDAVAKEVRRLAHELRSVTPTKPASIFSVAVGLPPMISLGINVPSLSAKRSVAFVRDIYDNHAVPLSLPAMSSEFSARRLMSLHSSPCVRSHPARTSWTSSWRRCG